MITEMTDDENITLECAQEADKADKRCGQVDADDVVKYAGQNDILMTKAKATRVLSRLASQGILIREPRASRGWGLGWYPSTYSLAPTARIKG